ncbi:DUF262 domain-containing protein [Streptomyces sp. B3I8]|uniref:DUF262 domain-containing protein n=1 Tax=Streptomyces sp. B3I8 TaxID=3042303 RepID=UPI0027D8194C|nr:DUF262 domain-containing protein [Streptomyces sp. B3I8]
MSALGSDGFEETAEELEGGGLNDDAKSALRRRWESHQLDLLSHTMDFSVSYFASLVEREELDLNPEFERRDRWDRGRQSRLIESLLLNIPVPPVFLGEGDYGRYFVIDGRHRISALVDFINDTYKLTDLEILYEANGKQFRDLDTAMQRSLLSRSTLRAIILDRLSDPEMTYEVFARLNTGGVPLNAQELRNAVYPGPFNRLTVELAESPIFREALGQGRSSAYSKIWREMRDVELVLRYFTLTEDLHAYHGSMSHALSQTLLRKNQSPEDELQRDREDFIATVEKCHSAFGELTFRRWRPEANSPSQQITVALYDAEMVAVRDFDLAAISQKSDEIQDALKQLFLDDVFLESLRFGSSVPHSSYIRIDFLRHLLESILG